MLNFPQPYVQAYHSDPGDRARDVMVCVHTAMRTTSSAPGRLWPANSRHLRRIRGASPSSRIQHLDTAHCSQQPPSPARPRSAAFLEKKIASLLLTYFPRPSGFLRQKELYQLTKTCWTPYVIRWNIRDDAIRSPGMCLFWRKYTGFFSIFHIPDFFPFSPDFPPFFME